MKTREEFITDMCLTYRHDYGLIKEPGDPSWTSGMTIEDRKKLWLVMSQIYDNNIEPLMKELQEKETNEPNRKTRSKKSVLDSNKRQRKSRKRNS